MSLQIRVEITEDTPIRDAIKKMKTSAEFLKVTHVADFNGIELQVSAGSDAE